MKTLPFLSILALALINSAALAQDQAPASTRQIIIGQLEQLPVGVKAPCDKDHIGRLNLEISSYSFYLPRVTVCVRKERWGELVYENEGKVLSEEYAGRKVSAESFGSAVVWNPETEQVEGYVLGSLAYHTSGTACTFQSSVTRGSGSCGIQWKDSDGKDFLIFEGHQIKTQLVGHAITIPLSRDIALRELPLQTPDEILERLKTEADPDQKDEYLAALSVRVKRLPVEQQIVFVDRVHGLVQDGSIETALFHSFLGNLGLEYGVPFARDLLKSEDVASVRAGLNIIRQVRSAEVRALHVEVFKRFYPKAVDVGSTWGDFQSANVIRDIISYLERSGTSAEKDQIRAIRDSTVGTLFAVDSYLRS